MVNNHQHYISYKAKAKQFLQKARTHLRHVNGYFIGEKFSQKLCCLGNLLPPLVQSPKTILRKSKVKYYQVSANEENREQFDDHNDNMTKRMPCILKLIRKYIAENPMPRRTRIENYKKNYKSN